MNRETKTNSWLWISAGISLIVFLFISWVVGLIGFIGTAVYGVVQSTKQ